MMRCPRCRDGLLEPCSVSISRQLGARVFRGSVRGHRCLVCDVVGQAAGEEASFERHIAMLLAEQGFQRGDEVRFLRKTLGLRAVDLAQLLEVTPETVSHWETGKYPTNAITRQVIASLVLDHLEGRSSTRDRLMAMQRPTLDGPSIDVSRHERKAG